MERVREIIRPVIRVSKAAFLSPFANFAEMERESTEWMPTAQRARHSVYSGEASC